MTRAFERGLRRLAAAGLARTALAIAVVQFSIVVAVAGYAAQAGPREPFAGTWQELANPGGDALSALVAPLQRWDGLWFQHIAREGYAPEDGTTAFLPLFPALGSLVSRILLGNVAAALVIVACAAYAVALWLLGRLALLEASWPDTTMAGSPGRPTGEPGRLAILTMLGLATFPTAFFLVAPFTESLFLALALATLLLARRGRLGGAAVTGALASIVRVQGVFLALPIAWEALRAAGLLRRPLRRPDRRSARVLVLGLVAAAAPIAALLGWYGALSMILGSPAVGLSAQAPWGYQLTAPWNALAASLADVRRQWPRPLGLIEALNLASLLGFVALIVAARRLPASHTLYAIPSLALVGSRVMWFLPLMSMSRFVLVIFPGFLGLGLLLDRHPRAALGWLVISTAVQLVLVQWFARWGFVA